MVPRTHYLIWAAITSTLHAGCGDQDCREWYSFDIPSEVRGASDTSPILYGERGLILVQDWFSYWPPAPWVERESHTSENLRHAFRDMLVVGEHGTIRYSSDAGQSWNTPDVPAISAHLLAVEGDCRTNVGAVAVGEAGTIVRTDDLTHWELVAPIGDRTLRDVAYVDPNVVAVGDKGTILLSTSRGLTWRTVDASIQDDILAVDFPPSCADDGSRSRYPGLLMTSSGTFYMSENRGKSWERLFPDAPGKPRAMHIFDHSPGYNSFGGFAAQVAIDGQLWAIHGRESPANKDWVMLKEFPDPILDIFAWTAAITEGETQLYRDGFRCHGPE